MVHGAAQQPQSSKPAYNTPITYDQTIQALQKVDTKEYADLEFLVNELEKYLNPAIKQAQSESQKPNLTPAQQTSLKNLQEQFNGLTGGIKVHKDNIQKVHDHFSAIVRQIRPNNIIQSSQSLKEFLKTDFQGYSLSEFFYNLFYTYNLAANQYLIDNATGSAELKKSIITLAKIGRFIDDSLLDIVTDVYNGVENLQVVAISGGK